MQQSDAHLPREPVDLPVLIVSYRAAGLLEKCLISVKAFHPGHDVLIWDNTGPDSMEIRQLAARYPEFRWHFSPRNIGFAAAVNRLAEKIPGRDFLLLNPDAELVAPLRKTLALIGQPGVAAAGPMIETPPNNHGLQSSDRKGRVRPYAVRPWDSCYRKLTFINTLGTEAGLGRLRGSPLSRGYPNQPREVDGYISGCCLAIRRDAWDELGPFDERFFLYGEEAQWQRRANASGWKIKLADEIALRHNNRGTVQGDCYRFQRSEDLLRASHALQIELIYGDRLADFFLAWCSLMHGLKRLVHRQPAPTADRGHVLVPVDIAGPHGRHRIATALDLEKAGHTVTVASLQRLGTLPMELPPAIRLVRMAWWWPWLPPGGKLPSAVIQGETARERMFSQLLRLRGTRVLQSARGITSDEGLRRLPAQRTGL